MKQTSSIVLLALLNGTKAIQNKHRLDNRGVFEEMDVQITQEKLNQAYLNPDIDDDEPE